MPDVLVRQLIIVLMVDNHRLEAMFRQQELPLEFGMLDKELGFRDKL